MFGISFVGHNCANVSLFVCLSFVISRVNTFFGVFVLLPHPIESTHLSVFWEYLSLLVVCLGCVSGTPQRVVPGTQPKHLSVF